MDEKLYNIINNFDVDVIISLYREVCRTNNYEDGPYYMMDFAELMGNDFNEIYPKLADDFNMNDNYFWFDGLGYIHSGSAGDYIESELDWDVLYRYVSDNFGVVDIDDDDFNDYRDKLMYGDVDDDDDD